MIPTETNTVISCNVMHIIDYIYAVNEMSLQSGFSMYLLELVVLEQSTNHDASIYV